MSETPKRRKRYRSHKDNETIENELAKFEKDIPEPEKKDNIKKKVSYWYRLVMRRNKPTDILDDVVSVKNDDFLQSKMELPEYERREYIVREIIGYDGENYKSNMLDNDLYMYIYKSYNKHPNIDMIKMTSMLKKVNSKDAYEKIKDIANDIGVKYSIDKNDNIRFMKGRKNDRELIKEWLNIFFYVYPDELDYFDYNKSILPLLCDYVIELSRSMKTFKRSAIGMRYIEHSYLN